MYAVIQTGGFQYRVVKNDVLNVARMNKQAGDKFEIDNVLLVAGDGAFVLGKPTISGAKVLAEVIVEARGPKMIVFKRKRKKNYIRKKGHRQWFTQIRITDIVNG